MMDPAIAEHRHGGFTLVEVLVALLLLGVVSTGLLALSRDTLRYSGLSTAISTKVEDVADAEGYLADTFRNAKAVFSTLQLVDTSGTTILDCDLTGTARCVAVLSPVQDASDPAQPIVNFDLSVFSVEPIGTKLAAEGLERGWAGQSTLALFEYRVPNVCATPCSVAPSTLDVPQRTWTGSLGFLLGGLSAVDRDGNPVDFFRTDNPGSFVINLVAKANAAAGQPFVVRRMPVALQVAVRE